MKENPTDDFFRNLLKIPENDAAEKIDWQRVGSELPVLPLRDNVLFPKIVMPVNTSRAVSVEVLKECFNSETFVVCVTQKNSDSTAPSFEELFPCGTIARTAAVRENPDGSLSAVLQGIIRVRITGGDNSPDGHLTVRYKPLRDFMPDKNDAEFDALVKSIKETSLEFVNMGGNYDPNVILAVKNIKAPAFLISFITTNCGISVKDKNALLSINSVKKRAAELLGLLGAEREKFRLQGDIEDKVKKQMDKQQREYYLNQQIKTLQKELGNDPAAAQLDELEILSKEKNWPEYAAKAFEKQFSRLKTINPQSPDFAIELSYCQTLLELPWLDYTEDDFTIGSAKEVLDSDHYGLEKVKERILEYLAVLKLKRNLKSPILCLYGPPGVGKTSLGKSIASALKRKYVRVSLGGLYDEAEIRGHRRTYIGAMPGRIIKNIKKAGSSNPVFVLDEIDKIASDVHGDPASALLEVLDPEQNAEFHDNYLDLDYDLSGVLFVATANNINKISAALLDRMEMIEVSGYVTEEKLEILKRHLLPKILENHGLKSENFLLPDTVAKFVIDNYTRESGVRELSTVLASLVRKTAVRVASGECSGETLSEEAVIKKLGKPKYFHDGYFETRQPGVIPGLAWTSAGGELLYIEALLSNGNGTLNITGNVGKVMKESAEIALNYLCANEETLGINHRMFREFDLSLHFPEGAVPKDGPSAGITIFTSLASVYTQRPVKPGIAMTGELTLSGRVLPVGGIKEKILGAKRAGITKIFMSEENRRDIEEINPLYIDGLEFVYVKTATELIPQVLEKEKIKNAIKLKARGRKNVDTD
jgi:ATP-dependent Lon protease